MKEFAWPPKTSRHICLLGRPKILVQASEDTSKEVGERGPIVLHDWKAPLNVATIQSSNTRSVAIRLECVATEVGRIASPTEAGSL
jgi:hypothetical protein